VWQQKQVRVAIMTRLREKQLLQHALTLVDQLEAQFDHLDDDNTTAVNSTAFSYQVGIEAGRNYPHCNRSSRQSIKPNRA